MKELQEISKGVIKMLQTEYEFTLPKGYMDKDGNLHKNGVMRVARAIDEIRHLNNPKVRQNPEYLMVLVLSDVVTKLGDMAKVTNEVIEGLFLSDLNFLQNMYSTINDSQDPVIHVCCPICGQEFTEPVNFTKME